MKSRLCRPPRSRNRSNGSAAHPDQRKKRCGRSGGRHCPIEPRPGAGTWQIDGEARREATRESAPAGGIRCTMLAAGDGAAGVEFPGRRGRLVPRVSGAPSSSQRFMRSPITRIEPRAQLGPETLLLRVSKVGKDDGHDSGRRRRKEDAVFGPGPAGSFGSFSGPGRRNRVEWRPLRQPKHCRLPCTAGRDRMPWLAGGNVCGRSGHRNGNAPPKISTVSVPSVPRWAREGGCTPRPVIAAGGRRPGWRSRAIMPLLPSFLLQKLLARRG